MDNRDTILNAQFPPTVHPVPFLEVDLRTLNGFGTVGRRGQLQIGSKLVFKATEEFRKGQSVFWLWADVRVEGQDGGTLPSLGRAAITEPIFFGPPGDDTFAPHGSDPWMRARDDFQLELDFRHLDEIERKRNGGGLTFKFNLGGTVYHDGQMGILYAVNNSLWFPIGASDWQQVLTQFNYGTFVNVEIPLTGPGEVTGKLRTATEALHAARDAFRRGEYEEAVLDCRPGVEAMLDADKGKYSLKVGDHDAGKDERFHWMLDALLRITHLAHHPNDPAAASSSAGKVRWGRADAEAAISLLAAMIRQRVAS